MADKSGQKFALPKQSSLVAELFTTQEQRDEVSREKVLDILLVEIDDFPGHPFLVKMDESMQAMVDSIKTIGVQTPAVVRRKDDGRYELVSGHRRKGASELAGLETMPCIVRELTYDEAVITMVDANLQRETILPSEKARSYKMKMEAMKRQGQRTDLSSSPLAMKLKGKQTAEIIGEAAGDSKDQVYRYIRLTELNPPMLNMVDDGRIAIRPAVELSYLPQEQQQILLDAIGSEDRTPSHVQATKLRKLSNEGQLDYDAIVSIIKDEAPPRTEHFKLPKEKIQHFFSMDTPAQTIEETMIKALELWYKNQ